MQNDDMWHFEFYYGAGALFIDAPKMNIWSSSSSFDEELYEIIMMDFLLEVGGCIDSTVDHQWHCDPVHCRDWETQREGIGSLLTVAPIDTTGRFGRGYE